MRAKPATSGKGRYATGIDVAENCCHDLRNKEIAMGSQTMGTTNHCVRVRTFVRLSSSGSKQR